MGGSRNPQQGQGGELDGIVDDEGVMAAGMDVEVGMNGVSARGMEADQSTPRHAVGLSQLFRSPAAVATKGLAQDDASGSKVRIM